MKKEHKTYAIFFRKKDGSKHIVEETDSMKYAQSYCSKYKWKVPNDLFWGRVNKPEEALK